MRIETRLVALGCMLLVSIVATATPLEDRLLASAAARLDVKGVELAIIRGAKVDQKLTHPDAPSVIRTPIQFALSALIANRDAESAAKAERILRALFKAGGKVTGYEGELFSAIQGGYDTILLLLLNNGANPHDRLYGYTAAETAIKYDQSKLLPTLYARGVPKVDESTAAQIQFVQAASVRNILHMRLAVGAGAAVNHPDPAGRLAIVEVFSAPLWDPDNLAAVSYLLEFGADPSQAEYADTKSTALHNLIKRNSFRPEQYSMTAAITEILLQRGAPVSAEDSLGRTPLHYAAQHGNIPVIKLLLSNGAKVMPRDVFRRTPLDMAKSGAAINLLRDAGARE